MKCFKTKISDISSENISEKYSNSSKDLNKRKIKRVFKFKENQNLINILNSNIELYYDKYINDKKINGFKTIKDDVNELKIQIDEFKAKKYRRIYKKYEYITKNLKDIFLRKDQEMTTIKFKLINIKFLNIYLCILVVSMK